MKNGHNRSLVPGDGRQNKPVLLLISVFLYLATISPVLSAEPISIATVFSSAEYHLHSVTLQGIIKQIRPVAPHFGRLCRVQGSYTFTLEDSTGSIDVEVPGTCWPFSSATAVTEGEPIMLDALIHRFTRDGDGQRIVRAEAQKIW